jgi:hypothetical protein
MSKTYNFLANYKIGSSMCFTLHMSCHTMRSSDMIVFLIQRWRENNKLHRHVDVHSPFIIATSSDGNSRRSKIEKLERFVCCSTTEKLRSGWKRTSWADLFQTSEMWDACWYATNFTATLITGSNCSGKAHLAAKSTRKRVQQTVLSWLLSSQGEYKTPTRWYPIKNWTCVHQPTT